MRTVLIQTDTAVAADLKPGETATFGRGADDVPVDIVVADRAVSRLAGRIQAVEDYWLISNLSAERTYVVENPEGGGEFVKVPPLRMGMPVPFEFSRVILPAEHGTTGFLVFAPEHVYGMSAVVPGTGATTRGVFPLDRTAKYFLILVALCEARLHDPSSTVVPTVPQLIERLAGHELTRSGVNFHIDYLAGTKLRVKHPDEGGKADWQRAALINLALRFDLVTDADLRLLP
ncbi:FHA domain-containing protein [Nonomuraea guangzhouensis]|uniref:FHA domain-containing protein n=1 Tax=Nonomuraea guangzhouensis TaxID=1291555 RepID=A0ABW4GJY1_9ACTN|nr:FHA domain-containing protein [Nonomuraea guangzhouensis]